MEIIDTYIDARKSGLDLAHRPGLRVLLEDITCGRAEFSAVLVFDVSRWGRFQDSDEAAIMNSCAKKPALEFTTAPNRSPTIPVCPQLYLRL